MHAMVCLQACGWHGMKTLKAMVSQTMFYVWQHIWPTVKWISISYSVSLCPPIEYVVVRSCLLVSSSCQIHEVIFTNPEGEARGVGEYYRVCLDEDTSRHDLTVLYPTHIATYLQPLQHTRAVPLHEGSKIPIHQTQIPHVISDNSFAS